MKPLTDAVARTKADPNRSMREDALVAEIECLRAMLDEVAEGMSWAQEKTELHVKQRLREHVDIALTVVEHPDGGFHAFLREGGEDAVWRTILRALEVAGWEICEKKP
jgi:hypothetical protein